MLEAMTAALTTAGTLSCRSPCRHCRTSSRVAGCKATRGQASKNSGKNLRTLAAGSACSTASSGKKTCKCKLPRCMGLLSIKCQAGYRKSLAAVAAMHGCLSPVVAVYLYSISALSGSAVYQSANACKRSVDSRTKVRAADFYFFCGISTQSGVVEQLHSFVLCAAHTRAEKYEGLCRGCIPYAQHLCRRIMGTSAADCEPSRVFRIAHATERASRSRCAC